MLRMLISDIETNFGGQIGSYSFPPHNVIRVADDHVQIQIAVAGFAKEDISIEQVDDMLVVSGTKKRFWCHISVSRTGFKKFRA